MNLSTCRRCLDGRHIRCEDRVGCGCQICGDERRAAIGRVRTGANNWRRKGPMPSVPSRPRKSTGVGRPPKLSREQQKAVKAFVEAGNSRNAAAREFGISWKTVQRCVREDFKNDQWVGPEVA